MPATTFTLNKVLDYLFGSAAYSAPNPLYFGLSTTLVNATGYATVTEPVAMAYARASLNNDKTDWGDSVAGVLDNDVALVFPESTGNWGTILSIFIIGTASGAGDVIWYYTLNPTVAIGDNTIATWAAGHIITTLT